MSEDLLKIWTKQAYGLLDSVYDTERIEKLDNTIFDLRKIGIDELTLYNIDGDDITVRYSDRGCQTFKTFNL